MRNLASNIVRQRFLIEGLFSGRINEAKIRGYFVRVTKLLKLEMYADPIIYSPKGMGKPENQGYDAFAPLVDSGISVYVWNNAKFLSILIYSCKKFDKAKAKKITREYFNLDKIESKAF